MKVSNTICDVIVARYIKDSCQRRAATSCMVCSNCALSGAEFGVRGKMYRLRCAKPYYERAAADYDAIDAKF